MNLLNLILQILFRLKPKKEKQNKPISQKRQIKIRNRESKEGRKQL